MTYYKSPDGAVYDFQHEPSGLGWERMTNKAGKAARAEYCKAELRKLLPPGATVHCILKHVARSGMSRRIQPVVIVDGAPRVITNLAADAAGFRTHGDSIVMGGCGMDMGFALVYELAHALYPDGFGELPREFKGAPFTGKRRPRTPLEAAKMVSQGYTFCGRNGDTSGWDNCGGYALRKEWL